MATRSGTAICDSFFRRISIVNRQSRKPVAAIAFAFSAGIAISLICRSYSFSGLVAGDICLICAAYLALRRNRVALSLTIGLAAVTAGGLLLALAHRDGFGDSDLRYLVPRQIFPLGEPVSFEGCVVEESQKRGEETTSIIKLYAFLRKDQWTACKGKGILKIAEPDQAESSPQS